MAASGAGGGGSTAGAGGRAAVGGGDAVLTGGGGVSALTVAGGDIGVAGCGNAGAKATSIPPATAGGPCNGIGDGSRTSSANKIACAASDRASGSLNPVT
jgi:hypothetical protein